MSEQRLIDANELIDDLVMMRITTKKKRVYAERRARMNRAELEVILEKHKKWLMGKDDECRADLSHADLSGADLSNADLYGVDLSYANLSHADLSSANLGDVDLYCANLSNANMGYANLRRSDLRHANLKGTELRYANLDGANLIDADLSGARSDMSTTMLNLACPEEGEFIGWKKASGLIVKLLILADAKRSSATTRKCRCSKAKVLSIQTIEGVEAKQQFVASNHDPRFLYRVGETVEVADFDEDRWNECSTGIHFFITRREAEQWNMI